MYDSWDRSVSTVTMLHGCIVRVVLLHIFMLKPYCYLIVVYSYA